MACFVCPYVYISVCVCVCDLVSKWMNIISFYAGVNSMFMLYVSACTYTSTHAYVHVLLHVHTHNVCVQRCSVICMVRHRWCSMYSSLAPPCVISAFYLAVRFASPAIVHLLPYITPFLHSCTCTCTFTLYDVHGPTMTVFFNVYIHSCTQMNCMWIGNILSPKALCVFVYMSYW